MNEILEELGLEHIIDVILRLKDLLISCVNFTTKCFSWLGTDFAVILLVGITLAIILRILGR